MRRFLSVFLSLAITLCCLIFPASAAEASPAAGAKEDVLFPAVKAYEGFEDVSEDDWFAPYVRLCAETGLMEGVGDGRFDPQGQVTYAQTATLAARIHSVRNGGDGAFEKAPDNWGLLELEPEDGAVLTFDSTQYRTTIAPMSAGLGTYVNEEQRSALDWLETDQDASAVVTAHFAQDIGPLPCLIHWNSSKEKVFLSIRNASEAPEEERDAFRQIVRGVNFRRPTEGDWFRDRVYYIEKAGLAGQLSFYVQYPDDAVNRMDFIECLDVVSEGILEPINEIEDYPDSGMNQEERQAVLRFYNAGILTGKDEYGTFDPKGTLTRAECAAMLARLVRPELRLKFQPTPVPEKYSYTLTYLMDDPMSSHTVTSPVLPIITEDGKDNGILTLDGELLPFPGDGTAPVSMYTSGYGDLFMSFWFTQADGSKVEKGGVIDGSGTFVVPLTAGCNRGWPLDDGRYITLSGAYGGEATLWDREGNTTPLGVLSFEDLISQYPRAVPKGLGLDVSAWGSCYVDEKKHPVSEEFTWIGALTGDGRGFVNKDGKIYCIQFEK